MEKRADRTAGQAPGNDGLQVDVGTHVEVELLTTEGAGEYLQFDLVPDDKADFAAGFLGAGTPLARAILGQCAGIQVDYMAADVVQVRILSVAPGANTPSEDRAAERQAIIRDAVSRSNLVDAQRLALTVDVKWGDYDPEGLEAGWEDD
jgi:hypothetical protein